MSTYRWQAVLVQTLREAIEAVAIVESVVSTSTALCAPLMI